MSITKQMLQILFPDTKGIDQVASILDFYRSKFGVDTNLRLAMFLSQVREEIGSDFKIIRESLNYSEESLLKTFKVFKDNPQLAEEYGRDENTPKANQEAIANLSYANRLGNGNADSDNDGDLDKDDDGWKYRGAGCLQITGKSNFEEVIKRINKYSPNGNTNPDTLEGFILFGLGFWIWQDLYKQADNGNVDKVTEKVNKYTHSYESRKSHYNKIKHLV